MHCLYRILGLHHSIGDFDYLARFDRLNLNLKSDGLLVQLKDGRTLVKIMAMILLSIVLLILTIIAQWKSW